MNDRNTSHPNLDRLQRGALIAAAVGLVLVALGAVLAVVGGRLVSPPDEPGGWRGFVHYWVALGPFPWQQFFQSYLIGYVTWLQISLGCLGLALLHHLAGGNWGLATSRLFEAGSRTLPLMAVLFLPLIPALPHLYVWTHFDPEVHGHGAPHAMEADNPHGNPATIDAGPFGELDPFVVHAIEVKAKWLSVPRWLIFAAVYFAVWLLLMGIANRWSHRQDEAVDLDLNRKLRRLGSGGLLLLGLSTTFAAFDWLMSLEPAWFSTIYGAVFAVGAVVGGMALAIPVAALLADRPPMSHVATPGVFNDFGSLLLAFVMLWSYVAFSQFLIIWSGNLPDEALWYMARARGGWVWVAAALAVLHFALPFLLLLSREFKRNALALSWLACGVLAMRLVDMFWHVAPAFRPAVWIHWLDLAMPLAIGGIWLWVFVWTLRKWPLLAPNDPVWEHHGHYPPEAHE